MILQAAPPPALVQSTSTSADAPWQRDLAAFDAELAKREAVFAAEKVSGDTRDGAKRILAHLLDLDQFSRMAWSMPHDHGYGGSKAEEAFFAAYLPRQKRVDDANIRVFKSLLDHWGWFNRTTWGEAADHEAWLLAQHADDDLAFQKRVLDLLGPLAVSGETDLTHYAYLYDRLAVNEHRLQRFGTQGFCTGAGAWTPRPIEDPGHVDERRKGVGLEPLADYIASFKDLCHEDQTERALKTLPLPSK